MRLALKPTPSTSHSEKRTGGGATTVSGYFHGRRELTWSQLSDGTYSLHCGQQRTPMLSVIRDGVHVGMWRIRHVDGGLSDLVNLSRAKDAAMSVALGILNRN